VGGIDDKNTFSHEEIALWHSNYGSASNDVPKPDLVAPSIWVAAPVLPNTSVADEARSLFVPRKQRAPVANGRIADLKLITPHYQHVEGTSFAAPIVASCIACLLEANPALTPLLVRDVLEDTAHFIPGADRERQGAGAVAPGQAVARALAERHSHSARQQVSPQLSAEGIVFSLHDHAASSVEVPGSWNDWRPLGIAAKPIETGYWQTLPVHLPAGRYTYKSLVDGQRWLDDPNNPSKAPDGLGGLNSAVVVPADDHTRLSEDDRLRSTGATQIRS
jgi:serine protease AprX